MPLRGAGGERVLGGNGPKKSISLKKSRCARHQADPKTVENRDFAADNRKSEDFAKMTHSIPDFVNQSSNIFPILRERVTNIQYQYLERCKSIFSAVLRFAFVCVLSSHGFVCFFVSCSPDITSNVAKYPSLATTIAHVLCYSAEEIQNWQNGKNQQFYQ